jgi:glycosyltransferase involved in cell wall biosynthesis
VNTVSVVVVARDEQAMLPGCLRRLGFADEVIVLLDDRTTDGSAEVARAAGAALFTETFVDFAQFKNVALSRASSDWVLVVDADERVTEQLAAEVRAAVDEPGQDRVYRVPIRNVFLGREMRHGGWTGERPIRLFPSHVRYEGSLHETPAVPADSDVRDFAGGLVHFSHRSVVDNLDKTSRYAVLQAQQMLAEGAPHMNSRRLLWSGLRELARRLIRHRGYRDGEAGVAEALYQALSIAAVHIRLWELQQPVPIDERYRTMDEEVL